MYSIYQRLNVLSALLSSCLLALVAAVAVSSFAFPADPKGSLAVTNIKVYPGNARYYRQRNREFTFVRFNATADLTSLFNWNTKQLFLYIGAEYENAQGTKNEVVIWDRIVRRKEDAVINLSGKNKYMFKDVSKSFKGVQPAHYTLKYNIMPYIGFLTYGEAARTDEPVPFPAMREKVA